MKRSQQIKLALALAIVASLFLFTDLGKLGRALSNLSFGMICYLLLISVALVYVSAIKWHYFLKALGPAESVFRLFNHYLVGYFVNLLVPSYVGGDAVRSVYAGKKTGTHAAFAATILERYTGLVAMVILALCFVWQATKVTVEIKAVVVLSAVGLLVGTLVALSPRAIKLLGSISLASFAVPHLNKVQESFHIIRNQPRVWLKALILSFLFHCLTVVNVVAAAHAVGWLSAPPGEIFVVLPIALLIGALPITPNGLGVQEGAYIYFFTGIGASIEQALGIGIILRAKSYILALVGGILWAVRQLRVKSELAPER